jgi:uncharacterized protein YecT (DUF1311 family)
MTAPHIFLTLVTLIIYLPTASAAAIQCKKATIQAEKLICSDQTLVRLDQDLNSAYSSTLANVDEKYKERVRESQKDWIAWRNELIDARIAQNHEPGLGQLFQERIGELRRANIKINSLAFLRLRGHQRPMYLLTELPGTEAYNYWAEKKWQEVTADNKNAKSHDSKVDCGGDCDPQVSVWRVFSLDFASSEMISVHETVLSDGGGAHPSNEDVHHNWWISKSGAITPSEIFDGTSYLKVIDKHVAKFYKDIGFEDAPSKQKKMATVEASKPTNWGLRANALHITGQGYDYNIGRGFVEIDIPWSAFGPGLNPDFKARLKSHKGATPTYE